MIPHYYEDPHTLHVGTMPNRAYYIPASRRSDALVEHRETSDRFQLLNGSWKFRYYASIYDLQDAFYEVGYDASAFDSIPVPSVWQNHGYDHHQYTNIRYPFPADPPYVPKENPCGAYLYDFTYQKDAAAPRAFLNFEGVASCFYVWLNGQFVGYSQVAHSTSEFDVTKFLQDGTNHLAVLVLKWCDGSYMEDQDMFRMNQDLPTKYAFELSAWDEILSWKLAPSSIYIYGLEFCLSRVLWEMTFFGVDESGVELEKEKLDTRFEEAQRFFDENKEPQIGFSIEDIAKKLLGDDYTEDWYPEEEQERDRRNMVISSYIASTTAALFWWVDG